MPLKYKLKFLLRRIIHEYFDRIFRPYTYIIDEATNEAITLAFLGIAVDINNKVFENLSPVSTKNKEG